MLTNDSADSVELFFLKGLYGFSRHFRVINVVKKIYTNYLIIINNKARARFKY